MNTEVDQTKPVEKKYVEGDDDDDNHLSGYSVVFIGLR